jgi:hypothetical protein
VSAEEWYYTDVDGPTATILGPSRVRTRAVDPAIVAIIGERLLWNIPLFGRLVRCDDLPGCEAGLLEANLQSKEQPEATRSKIQRFRWLVDDNSILLCKKLLHNERCVSGSVVVLGCPGIYFAITTLVIKLSDRIALSDPWE